MIIAIDGYEANEKNRVGVGRYAYEILRHVYDDIKNQKSNIKDTNQISKSLNYNFRIYLPSAPLPDMPEETPWWQYRVIHPKTLWTLFRLPLALTTDRPRADVVFSPTHYIPRFVRIPRVFSIMDLSYLEYPEMFRLKDLHQLVNWTRYSAEHAARILTISQFSKNAIIKAYGIPAERIEVTYPGITTMSNVKCQMSNVWERYGMQKHYILSVGTLQPRKNYVRLIEAFSMLIKDIFKQFPDLTLVIVGKKGWLYDEILAAPAKYGVAERVKFLDFVPDSDLPHLYRNALCLAMPSLYEGFGLPVLEAMAAGTAVVVSNTSSILEVAGKAGIYVDPLDIESISKGIQQAITEYKTKSWKDRIFLGKELAKQFTWEKAAKQTLEVLEEVGKSR